MTPSDRQRRIVGSLDIAADMTVLEIGCGHGVAATHVCERLRSGKLIAIDRSEKMIAAAGERNAEFVATGKAEFVVASMEDYDPGKLRFDLIFAVRVGLFHREPKRAWSIVEPWLAPGGAIHSFFDPPR